MKNIIILEKTKEKKKLSNFFIDITAVAEVIQILSSVDFAWKYRWAMNKADIDKAKKLEQTGIKKYWRYINQVEIELNWLYD